MNTFEHELLLGIASNYAAPMRWIMVNVDNHRTTMQQLAPEEAVQPINIQYTVTWPWHAIMDWALIPSERGQTVNHKLKHLLNKQLLLQQNHLLPQISALTERSLPNCINISFLRQKSPTFIVLISFISPVVVLTLQSEITNSKSNFCNKIVTFFPLQEIRELSPE